MRMSLFSFDDANHGLREMPYSMQILRTEGVCQKGVGCGSEWDAFAQTMEHEVNSYEPRGEVFGPIAASVDGGRERDLRRSTPLRLPPIVDRDAFAIRSLDARGVMLVDGHHAFDAVLRSKSFRAARILCVHSAGLPRLAVRRFLHRMRYEFDLPVLILADNSTWGLFIMSMVRRGALCPSMSIKSAAVPGARLVGIRSGEFDNSPAVMAVKVRWKKYWDDRLRCLRSYPCFKSRAWQQEIDLFEAQRFAIELRRLVPALGSGSLRQRPPDRRREPSHARVITDEGALAARVGKGGQGEARAFANRDFTAR